MSQLRIVIDTREQRAWYFPEEVATVRRGTLPTGDYALEGDTKFAIERKSLDDFLGTISSGWGRFESELARMIGWVAKVIIVEGTMLDVLQGRHNHPVLTLGFVAKRLATLTLSGVSVIFAGDNIMGAGLAWAILAQRNKDLENGTNTSSGSTAYEGSSMGVPQARKQVDDPQGDGVRAEIHSEGVHRV